MLADEMSSHFVCGVPAETPPVHPPLVLARTVEGETPLMAAAGCPSLACVELVSVGISVRRQLIGAAVDAVRDH